MVLYLLFTQLVEVGSLVGRALGREVHNILLRSSISKTISYARACTNLHKADLMPLIGDAREKSAFSAVGFPGDFRFINNGISGE